MAKSTQNDIKQGRLAQEDYLENFADLHAPFNKHEALVESDRCYFCFDAPCQTACPTTIDIPLFIRQISTGNAKGAAKTILDQNIMGGMCARVCPTETLCEEVCVREVAEGKPVRIGQLQRYATDVLMEETSSHPFERAASTGKRIAIIGAGPASLSCAHRLATYGHDITIFEARDKSGGLNEFGIAAYKSTDDFAAREVEFILGIGGITIETGKALGSDVSLAQLATQIKLLGAENVTIPLKGSNIKLEHRRIAVDDNQKTSEPGIWAGGDCVDGGEDLTVVAVEHGKIAAEDIHKSLME